MRFIALLCTVGEAFFELLLLLALLLSLLLRLLYPLLLVPLSDLPWYYASRCRDLEEIIYQKLCCDT